jgi:hypothetical protein
MKNIGVSKNHFEKTGNCFKNLNLLFTKEYKGLLIKEAQILCPYCIDEMDTHFTAQDVQEVTFGTNADKEAVCKDTPAEAGYWLLKMKELKY